MIFWTKFVQKRYFRSKLEQVNITIEFWHIRITLGTKFQLNWTILPNWTKFVWALNFSLNWKFWFFGPNLPKKGISGLKQKKHLPVSMVVTYCIKHFRTGADRNSGILMSLLLLVSEKKILWNYFNWCQAIDNSNACYKALNSLSNVNKLYMQKKSNRISTKVKLSPKGYSRRLKWANFHKEDLQNMPKG